MSSKVAICNLALMDLGCRPIIDINSDQTEAVKCNLAWEFAFPEVLRSHNWNFSIERRALNLSSETPAFGYAYKYTLPANCVKFLGPDESYIKYRVEKGFVLTDETSIYGYMIENITDANKFDAMFAPVLAKRIASMIAKSLTGSDEIGTVKYKEYLDMLERAKSVDGQEAGTWEAITDNGTDGWINNR